MSAIIALKVFKVKNRPKYSLKKIPPSCHRCLVKGESLTLSIL